MKKQPAKFPISWVFILIIFIWLFIIDWKNLFSKDNLGAIFGILASVFFIIAIRYQDNQNKKKDN